MPENIIGLIAADWLAALEELIAGDIGRAEMILSRSEPTSPATAERVWAGRYIVSESHTELIEAWQDYRAKLSLMPARQQQGISAVVYRLFLAWRQIDRQGELTPAAAVAFEESGRRTCGRQNGADLLREMSSSIARSMQRSRVPVSLTSKICLRLSTDRCQPISR
jgi:hypothetical protein